MSARRLTIACVVALAALFPACDEDDDDPKSTTTTGGRASTTGGAPASTGGGSTTTGGAADAGAAGDTGTKLSPCLDRPGELQRPPSGSLPCELLPPDFG